MKHPRYIVLAILLVALLTPGLLFGDEMRLAADSMLLSNGTWINVSELKAGDVVQTLEGHRIVITAVADVTDEPASCYTPVLNASNAVPVVEPGVPVARYVVERHCNWVCQLLGRLWAL